MIRRIKGHRFQTSNLDLSSYPREFPLGPYWVCHKSQLVGDNKSKSWTNLVAVCVSGLWVLGEGLLWWSTMLRKHWKRIASRYGEREQESDKLVKISNSPIEKNEFESTKLKEEISLISIKIFRDPSCKVIFFN